MLEDVDVDFQWPYFLVAFSSLIGILSGADKFIFDGIFKLMLSFSLEWTDYVLSFVFGPILILANAVSFHAAYT
ncbi:hypothetical protein BGX33_005704, partial [Mortierella sp. NVP41]